MAYLSIYGRAEICCNLLVVASPHFPSTFICSFAGAPGAEMEPGPISAGKSR